AQAVAASAGGAGRRLTASAAQGGGGACVYRGIVNATPTRGPAEDTPMRVTIHDVASHAGVSAMTVSRVINESPRVSADTRRRVQASIAKLGYVPNRLARGLIQRKTGSFGVIVPDVANPFFTLIVRGAAQVAWRA